MRETKLRVLANGLPASRPYAISLLAEESTSARPLMVEAAEVEVDDLGREDVLGQMVRGVEVFPRQLRYGHMQDAYVAVPSYSRLGPDTAALLSQVVALAAFLADAANEMAADAGADGEPAAMCLGCERRVRGGRGHDLGCPVGPRG